jgi:hypothetical protein
MNTLQRFKSKPVVIEATQFDGSVNLESFPEARFSYNTIEEGGPYLYVHTDEGIMKARIGDWIIKGTQGEVYPCKPSVFAEKYERLE